MYKFSIKHSLFSAVALAALPILVHASATTGGAGAYLTDAYQELTMAMGNSAGSLPINGGTRVLAVQDATGGIVKYFAGDYVPDTSALFGCEEVRGTMANCLDIETAIPPTQALIECFSWNGVIMCECDTIDDCVTMANTICLPRGIDNLDCDEYGCSCALIP